MSVVLSELVSPSHTAVLTMEVQRAVIGDLSTIPELADAAADAGIVPNIARVLGAARALQVPVIHCLAEFRADRAGTIVNCALIGSVVRNPEHMLTGSPSAELVPELGPEPGDLISTRLHGVSPFIGTSLDPWLRSLGIRTVVATGVSLNLGVLGLAIEAVNFGYRVVVPKDTVVGVPADYANALLANTFPMISTLTMTDDLLNAWGSG
ncbi:MAG: cysteine hydrolase [Acidimicrobiales bacterium]